jgi:hypothetical protein
MPVSISRRAALVFAAAAPFGALAATAEPLPPACYDPARLPASQKSLRRALGFRDTSTDPVKHCGICAFFTGGKAGCGTCEILSGGSVTAGSVCNSWAKAS